MMIEVSDTHNDGDGADGVMSVTGEPSSDPMENRLMAPASGQQLFSFWFSASSSTSQHIRPPSAAGLSEHGHTRGCLSLKFFAPRPIYSSVLDNNQQVSLSKNKTTTDKLNKDETNYSGNTEGNWANSN